MSRHLRLCSGADAVRKFKRAGWAVDRQVGSHTMMVQDGYRFTLSIPQHKELGIGILKKLIKQAGMCIDYFNSI